LKQGLTHEELAELAEIHPACISLLENRKRNISLRIAERLAVALKVKLFSLIAKCERKG
jgi:transcriptional regulator with XRE-family HTH domain